MRKPLLKTLFCLSLLAPFMGSGQDKNVLEFGFVNPAEQVQTSVYWYWISGNISEEGVKKDLYSMKEAGINRAFIGNIGLESRRLIRPCRSIVRNGGKYCTQPLKQQRNWG